jgi:uncharacterized protein (TIGR03067 family)
MRIRGLLILAAASLVAAAPPREDAAKGDRERIQGTWTGVAIEVDGKPSPAHMVAALKLVFKGDTLTYVVGEPGATNFTFKLDPTTKPAGFDMTHADGENKGKTLRAVYSLEGDGLKICFGRPDQRPKELTAKAGSGQGLYVLKREKP